MFLKISATSLIKVTKICKKILSNKAKLIDAPNVALKNHVHSYALPFGLRLLMLLVKSGIVTLLDKQSCFTNTYLDSLIVKYSSSMMRLGHKTGFALLYRMRIPYKCQYFINN